MTKRDFSYKTSEDVVMEGYVESEVDYGGYDPIDYARVCLTDRRACQRICISTTWMMARLLAVISLT